MQALAHSIGRPLRERSTVYATPAHLFDYAD
jgi:hypothetical protein